MKFQLGSTAFKLSVEFQSNAKISMHKPAMDELNPSDAETGPLLLTWISNYIYYKAWDEITYPFPNFNSTTVEVWE